MILTVMAVIVAMKRTDVGPGSSSRRTSAFSSSVPGCGGVHDDTLLEMWRARK
jgi:hypothetical protein